MPQHCVPLNPVGTLSVPGLPFDAPVYECTTCGALVKDQGRYNHMEFHAVMEKVSA